jgi:hypothetical protein
MESMIRMLMRLCRKSTSCRTGRHPASVLARAALLTTLTAALALSAGVASAESGGLSGSHIGQLTAVSCSSVDACTAVGYDVPGFDHPTPALALAYRWNGKRWATQHLSTGSGAELRGVSCPSAKDCLAVGSAGEGELVERWRGVRWTRQSPSSTGDLLAISCSSVNGCIAVGSTALRWNGSAWKSQAISIPSGAYLDGVACPSAKLCFAVGGKPNGANQAVLVERWNGSDWSEQTAPSPKPKSGGPYLTSVACATVRSCTAVGSDGRGVLVEHWNGSKWIQQTAPRGDTNAVLSGVSCGSATACMAVGEQSVKPLGVLAESWNGKKWAVSKAPTPASSRGSAVLNSVSCRSAKACFAVGAGGDFSDNVETLIAERWNDCDWRLQ